MMMKAHARMGGDSMMMKRESGAQAMAIQRDRHGEAMMMRMYDRRQPVMMNVEHRGEPVMKMNAHGELTMTKVYDRRESMTMGVDERGGEAMMLKVGGAWEQPPPPPALMVAHLSASGEPSVSVERSLPLRVQAASFAQRPAATSPPRFFRAQYPGSAAPGGHMTARSVAPRSYPTPRGVLDMSSYQNDTPQQLHALNFSTRPAAERSA